MGCIGDELSKNHYSGLTDAACQDTAELSKAIHITCSFFHTAGKVQCKLENENPDTVVLRFVRPCKKKKKTTTHAHGPPEKGVEMSTLN